LTGFAKLLVTTNFKFEKTKRININFVSETRQDKMLTKTQEQSQELNLSKFGRNES
jgi:hypothetical protein